MTLHQLFENKHSEKFKPTTPSKRAEVRYRETLFLLIAKLKGTLQEKVRNFLRLNPNAKPPEIMNFIITQIERLRQVEILKFATLTATAMTTLVNKQNKKQIIESLQAGASVNVESLLNDEVVKDRLDEFISKNVSLITSVKNDLLTDIEDAVRNNYLESGRIERLSSIITERANVSKSRARLIARDQTLKLNADLQQDRTQSLGIKFYIWQTSRDERVRHTHHKMQGLMCRYDDDTVYSDDKGKTWKKRTADMPKTKPGREIQCRCFAVSVLGE